MIIKTIAESRNSTVVISTAPIPKPDAFAVTDDFEKPNRFFITATTSLYAVYLTV